MQLLRQLSCAFALMTKEVVHRRSPNNHIRPVLRRARTHATGCGRMSGGGRTSAAAYSITSSAVASSVTRTAMPSVLAVYRLMMNSNLVAPHHCEGVEPRRPVERDDAIARSRFDKDGCLIHGPSPLLELCGLRRGALPRSVRL